MIRFEIMPQKLFLIFFCCLITTTLCQDTVQDRITEIFGTDSGTMSVNPDTSVRAGFNVIVTPEPIVEPTLRPTILATNTGERCICVPYYLCDPTNNTIRTDGSFDGFGEIDVRFDPKSCQDVLDVCCRESQRQETPIEPPPVITQPNRPQGCGIRNVGGIDFTLTGNTNNEAGFGEFPWTMALIRISDDACLCGASLIHPNVILTGNHCVRLIPPTDLKIRAGEWDTQTTKERLPYQERIASRIISHPQYNTKTLANDIALIIIDDPFQLNDHINVICLPPQDFDFSNNECFASGWGKDVFGKAGKYSVIMKKVQLPIVSAASCQSSLQKTRLGPRFRLDPTFICAGGVQGIDTCQGDGGAPLVCPVGRQGDNRYAQGGAVSWGIGCKQNYPAVYTHVSRFRNWVDGEMRKLNYDTSVYTY